MKIDRADVTEPAGAFSAAVMLWVVLAGTASAILFLVLTAFAPELRGASNGAAHALSRSAVGFAGVIELLRDEGVPVLVSRSRHPERESGGALLVLTPGVDVEPDALKGLHPPGESLIVLPKWIAAPDPRHAGWVVKLGLSDATPGHAGVLGPIPGLANAMLSRRKQPSRPVLSGGGAFFAPETRIPLGSIQSFQAFSHLPDNWASALVDDQGRTVLALAPGQYGQFVLSDPDILNTQGLRQRDTAIAAGLLLNALRHDIHTVLFDVSLNGFARSRDILRLALEPPFLSATLCAVAAALLMGVHAAVRFGAPRAPTRALALGKRALADNSAALIRLARREPAMAARYATLIRDLVSREVAAARDVDEADLRATLNRVGRVRGVHETFAELEQAARATRHAPALMRTTRNLYRWRVEMTRGRS